MSGPLGYVFEEVQAHLLCVLKWQMVSLLCLLTVPVTFV